MTWVTYENQSKTQDIKNTACPPCQTTESGRFLYDLPLSVCQANELLPWTLSSPGQCQGLPGICQRECMLADEGALSCRCIGLSQRGTPEMWTLHLFEISFQWKWMGRSSSESIALKQADWVRFTTLTAWIFHKCKIGWNKEWNYMLKEICSEITRGEIKYPHSGEVDRTSSLLGQGW